MKPTNHKNEHKNTLNKMSTKNIQKHLQELQKEKMKLTTQTFEDFGSSKQTRNYPNNKDSKFVGNIKRLNKDIARTKTFLHNKKYLGGHTLK